MVPEQSSEVWLDRRAGFTEKVALELGFGDSLPQRADSTKVFTFSGERTS